MKKIALTGLVLGLVLSATKFQAAAMGLDGKEIETLTGLKGALDAQSGVFKVTKARTDVKVQVEGRDMPPFMGLGAWAAFTPMANGRAMVMGDNVLFEDEVNPVIDAALAGGLEVTALHNHFFYDEPKVYFMHVGGEGDPKRLAKAIAGLFETIKKIRTAAPQPAKAFAGEGLAPGSSITAEPLAAILGVKGQAQDGMFKAVIGRETSMGGAKIGAAMGANTWAAFCGTDKLAIVDGDFAMLEGEVQGVIKALRKGGINVVAIHSHMSGEQPHFLFLHYWGKGKALDLAKTLKKALEVQSVKAMASMGAHGG
jgi:hypothetical protein